MKCQERMAAFKSEMRQNLSILSEKLADLSAIQEETQTRLQFLEMYPSNYEIVEGDEKKEEKDGPKASMSSGFNVSRNCFKINRIP